MIEGRSSWARLGVSIHTSAGFGDIGFTGFWTLEITVVHEIKIYPFQEIAQLYYIQSTGPIDKMYDGKYQNSTDVLSSRLWTESE